MNLQSHHLYLSLVKFLLFILSEVILKSLKMGEEYLRPSFLIQRSLKVDILRAICQFSPASALV